MKATRTAFAQRGLTLVELMVALVLGLLVALLAAASLVVARTGFTSVDAGAQLRENTRFATSILQRVVQQAGFENAAGGNWSSWRLLCTTPGNTCGDASGDTNPGIRGFDNAYVADATQLPGGVAHNDRPAKCASADTSCASGSDVLMVRFWGDERAGVADGSMINCGGAPEPEGTRPGYSIFHIVRAASGEPVLACSYRNATTGAWTTVGLVDGVEAMQVLYGVDNVTPGVAPPTTIVMPGAAVGTPTGEDTVPERYLRAAQLDGPTAAATADNWRRVRAVRIGLVVRGAPGSAIDRASSGRTIDVPGLGTNDTNDVGARLTVAADGRLRQSIVFTVHLRNPQFYIQPQS